MALFPSFLVLIVLTTICVAVSCLPTEGGKENDLSDTTNNQPTTTIEKHPLFDFDHYQQLFHKKYGSRLERAFRKSLFLARAILAYASGVAYKFWRSTYYLAVNKFSDRSEKELNMMFSKANFNPDESETVREARETRGASELDDAQEKLDLNKVASELENEIKLTFEGVNDDDGLLEERHCTRQKRDLASSGGGESKTTHRQPRDMSMDKLLQANQPAVAKQAQLPINVYRFSPRLTDQLRWIDYGGMGSLTDQQEEVPLWYAKRQPQPREIVEPQKLVVEEPPTSTKSLFKKAKDALSPFKAKKATCKPVEKQQINVVLEEPRQLPDEMFVDLRKSGCMLEPKDQGDCGSCYAFAGVTLAEFHYCKATGKLVEFSEQYLVDCGKGRFRKMTGCLHGSPYNAPNFMHNYGMELAALYPYVAEEGKCPYQGKMDIKKTGAIRMELENYLEVPMNTWQFVLEHGPISVGVSIRSEFTHYGGGMYSNCDYEENHSVVLVGHGREDGEEFWLLRNSMGVDWGERGYFRIAKRSANRCFGFEGYVYGTKDGVNYDIKPIPNTANKAAMRYMMEAV